MQFTVKPTNWLDYAKATRKAYVEAREDKEYEFGIPLAGEILTDPTTYFGGYAIRGAVKGYKGAKTAVKGSTTYKTGASSLKPRKINDINSRLSKNSADSTPVPKTSTQIEKEVNAKNRGILNDFLFNSKFSGSLGRLLDPIFGQTIRYGNLSILGKSISNFYYRMSDDIRKVRIDKNNFNASGKDFGVDNMGKHVDDFLDEKGFTPVLKLKNNQKIFGTVD